MDIITNSNSAMDWFLENHTGWVKCVINGEEKVCSSYKQAYQFFRENEFCNALGHYGSEPTDSICPKCENPFNKP